MEFAQPQTIEDNHGLPTENIKFCGDAQELMAVIQGHKPVAANNFDRGYIHTPFFGMVTKNKQQVPIEHFCREYSYEDVYRASKKVHLLRYKYFKGAYFYFLREKSLEAYLLDLLWNNVLEQARVLGQYNLDYSENNIIVGFLLGYKKKDIRAWFLMALENIHKLIDFNNLDTREEKAKTKKFLKKKEELLQEFEPAYASALKKFAKMKNEIQVPSAWMAKCTTLPAPRSPGATRKKRT